MQRAIDVVIKVSFDELNIHEMDSHILETVETKLAREFRDGNILFYASSNEVQEVSVDIEKMRVAAKNFHDAGGHEAYWERIEQLEKEAI